MLLYGTRTIASEDQQMTQEKVETLIETIKEHLRKGERFFQIRTSGGDTIPSGFDVLLNSDFEHSLIPVKVTRVDDTLLNCAVTTKQVVDEVVILLAAEIIASDSGSISIAHLKDDEIGFLKTVLKNLSGTYFLDEKTRRVFIF